MIKNSKNPENIEEKMAEKLEKLREENKKLIANITKLKSEQQFIGLSFIEDDLETEQFIDDKCFEDILDNLGDKKKESNKEKDKNDIKTKTEKTTIDNIRARYLIQENIIKVKERTNNNKVFFI